MSPEDLDFTPLENALLSLKKAVTTPPKSELEQDGVIKRFEYAFELCWKSIGKMLKALGRTDVSGSPKPLFRDGLKENLLSDLKAWFKFLEARNLSAHMYGRKEAEEVLSAAKRFPPFAEELLRNLKRHRADA